MGFEDLTDEQFTHRLLNNFLKNDVLELFEQYLTKPLNDIMKERFTPIIDRASVLLGNSLRAKEELESTLVNLIRTRGDELTFVEMCKLPVAIDITHPTYWGAALAGEAGEVANITKKLERGNLSIEGDIKEKLGFELADVLIYTILSARIFDIDLKESFLKKLQIVSKRDYIKNINGTENNSVKTD